MKKIVLLYSGGLDSTVLLEMAMSFKMEVHCLIFNYGQIMQEEVDMAIQYCERHKVPYTRLNLDLRHLSSKLLDGTKANETTSEFHVPSRNSLFVSYAAGLCEKLNFNTIWLGANYEDKINQFPDCSQDWVYAINKVYAINGPFPIQVEAPLLGMTKPIVQYMAKQFNINQSNIFSGYGK